MNKLGKVGLLLSGFLALGSCDKSNKTVSGVDALQVKNRIVEKVSTHTVYRCFKILHPCYTRGECDFDLSHQEMDSGPEAFHVDVKIRVTPRPDLPNLRDKKVVVSMENPGYDVRLAWDDSTKQIQMDVRPLKTDVHKFKSTGTPLHLQPSGTVNVQSVDEKKKRIDKLVAVQGHGVLERFEQWLKALDIQVRLADDASIVMVSQQTKEKCIELFMLTEALYDQISVELPLAQGTCDTEKAQWLENRDDKKRQRCSRIGLLRSSLTQFFGVPVVLSDTDDCKGSEDIFQRYQEWAKAVHGLPVQWKECKLMLEGQPDPRACNLDYIMTNALAELTGHAHLRDFNGSCSDD